MTFKTWITQLFSSPPDAAATGAAVPQQPASAAAPIAATSAPAIDLSPAAIDTLYYRWITDASANDAAAQPALDKAILDALARLIASPGAGADLVPRVPAVIPQLLRSLRDESLSGADLARQLAQDVVLVAEVIREANSPFYHPTAPVKTIEGAVMLLGQNGLRMLIARVSFRPIISMQSGQHARQAAPAIWAQSEKCAHAASLLAPAMDANPFEAYLASLMQNVGLIVAFRLIDQMHSGPALPQSPQFTQALLADAHTLSARIALLWDFPATVSAAIAEAGQADAPALARALALADRVSKLRLLADAGQFDIDKADLRAALTPPECACFDKLTTEED
jgi:HD-like signal output (HDOD) protein